MAARRAQVGLRRRGPGLSRAAPWLVVLPALTGCLGLGEEDEARLTLHRQNSQDFYQRGSYVQALHQADMALSLDEDLVGMRLIRGFCLMKLGTARQNGEMLDDAVELFDTLAHGDGSDDFRAWLGAGQSRLARALHREREMGRIERRLAGDFLDAEGRRQERAELEQATAARWRDLDRSEEALQRVLDAELQEDNVYALIDLVLVLVNFPDRAADVLQHGRRAVELLVQSTELTENTLHKSLALSPSGRLNLQRRIKDNLAKERQLRDIVATVEFNRGNLSACLEELDAMEDRQLMTATQYMNRAGVYEQLGEIPLALADLEAFLRLRARTTDYDEVAAAVYERMERLRVLEQDARR